MPEKCVVADATKVLSLKNKTTPTPHLYSVEVGAYCYLTFEGQHYVKSSVLNRTDNNHRPVEIKKKKSKIFGLLFFPFRG